MDKTHLAWLAGFWDGEGSVGLSSNGNTRILSAQLSHTEIDSIEQILRILKRFKVNSRGYTYQERDPSKHRDAHYVRVSGINNIRHLAILLLPFAITKKRHWGLAIEWANSRIAAAGGVDKSGHLKRGGTAGWNPYSSRDLEIFSEFYVLNRRGPDDRARRREGRIAQ